MTAGIGRSGEASSGTSLVTDQYRVSGRRCVQASVPAPEPQQGFCGRVEPRAARSGCADRRSRATPKGPRRLRLWTEPNVALSACSSPRPGTYIPGRESTLRPTYRCLWRIGPRGKRITGQVRRQVVDITSDVDTYSPPPSALPRRRSSVTGLSVARSAARSHPGRTAPQIAGFSGDLRHDEFGLVEPKGRTVDPLQP
jgi:hypothetical protein